MVLVIKRKIFKSYYFDSFRVETPPTFLQKHNNLGSDERTREHDESFCDAYGLAVVIIVLIIVILILILISIDNHGQITTCHLLARSAGHVCWCNFF